MSIPGLRRSLFVAASLSCTLVVSARAVRAQEVFDAKAAAHLRGEYLSDLDSLHSKFVRLANAIPADKYAWRPAPGVRSISEAFMHVASEYYYYAPMSVGGKAPADFGAPKEKLPALERITGKDAVIAELDKAWMHCSSQLQAADPATLTGKYKPWGQPLDASAFAMTDDLHEHLGQLIAYARSVGVKPPWSK